MHRRAFLGATALTLAAPRLGLAQAGRVLRFVPQSDLAVLDPVWTSAYVTRHHAYMVFDTLYGVDSQFRASPQMVEGHVVDDDGKRWTLTLREGLRFHDGTPVLARDCVASLNRWGRRDNFGQGLFAATDELAAPDDRTLVFRLKRPFPQLPYALGKATNNMAAIMPERIAATDPFRQVPEVVGSGPFRFVTGERVPGSRYVYERFADYRPRPDGTPSGTAGPKVVNLDRVEWTVMPDPAAASGALRTGEIEWWELPPPDLLPLLKRDRNLAVEVQDPTGYVGILRMNHMVAPFDRKEIRAAVLGAVSQEEFMQAAAGTDPTLWKDKVGYFCPGTPMANATGLEALTGPRDIARARRQIQDAGYKGEKVVLLGATDLPILRAVADVTADLFQKLGFNLDYQAIDWGTLVQRRQSREPIEKGGWSVYSNFTGGSDQVSPVTHSMLWANGAGAAPGWPDSPAIESLRGRWLDAADPADQKRLAEELQGQAFRDVPYVPLGQYLYATAYRKSLTGVLGGFPVFWNVKAG